MTIPVEIVRPRLTGKDVIIRLLGDLMSLAINAWVLMIVLDALNIWALGYWHTVLLVVGVRVLQRSDSSYQMWTRMAEAKKK